MDENARTALVQLELIRPRIIAPRGEPAAVGYRAYVPHNQADLVTAAWHRGNVEESIASHRMEKDIRPTRIDTTGDEIPAVHFLYTLDPPFEACQSLLNSIRPSVRSITALGWGIDQVAADATLMTESDSGALVGERWRPTSIGNRPLRVPRDGSLKALETRHAITLSRIVDGNFTPVPPITAFETIPYRSADAPLAKPCVLFRLLDENDDTYRHSHTRLVHLAGMVRHLAIKRMKDDPPAWIPDKDQAEWVNRAVRGKRDETAPLHQQFSYIPLPSIGVAHADAMIRNVMVVAPLGMERELAHLAERLNGEFLVPEVKSGADETKSEPTEAQRIRLERFTPPRRKFIDEFYLGTSRVWHTVTPVILDGHNKKSKSDKPEAIARESRNLISKALQRAGVETPCEFSWQSVPYLKNCLSAHKYDRDGRPTGYHRPLRLREFTALHVRLVFTHPVPGPLAIGAGRHCGFGLFAVEKELDESD